MNPNSTPLPERAQRLTAVICDDWPVVGAGHLPGEPAVVVSANRVIAASLAARSLGVEVGLRQREAQRRAPGVAVSAPDPAAEARCFAAVLQAIDEITPRVEIDRPGQCTFLTRGPSRYFGGDEAMGSRVAADVAEVLEGRTAVRVGTADGRFAAVRAAMSAPADGVRTVAPGDSAAFVADLPVGVLAQLVDDRSRLRAELEDLVDVLGRLGLHTVGAFAALSPADVTARFGAAGARAHCWSGASDDRPAAPQDPPPDLEVAIELDPPVGRVDQAAFVAKALAEDFLRQLGARGVSCARVAVVAETEHGEEQVRLWRSDEAFSAPAIAERMRWQLDGWLSGATRQRPTGGLSRLALRPDEIGAAVGRQLGFWGERTDLAERAARAVARVQGIAGPGVALVAEVRGGRHVGDEVAAIPAEAVDIVERAAAVDRRRVSGDPDPPDAGVVAADHDRSAPWWGQLPPPRPALVSHPPLPVTLTDEGGATVDVDGRGVMRRLPVSVAIDGRAPVEVVASSGPWLLDERWWREDRRRRARLQVLLADGRALLVSRAGGEWWLDAAYD